MKRSELVNYLDGVTHQQLGAWLEANPDYYMKGIEIINLNGVDSIKCRALSNGLISYYNRKLEKLVKTAFGNYVPATQVVEIEIMKVYGKSIEYVAVDEYSKIMTCPVSGVNFKVEDGEEIDGVVICKHMKNQITATSPLTGERHLIQNMIKINQFAISTTGDIEIVDTHIFKNELDEHPEKFGTCEVSGETVLASDLVDFMGKKMSKVVLYRLGYIVTENGSVIKLDECIFIPELGWVKESDIDPNEWHKCAICGQYHKTSRMHCYDGDVYVCDACQRHSNIGSYHSGRSNGIYRPMSLENEDTKLFFGAEIETEGNTWSSALVAKDYGDLFHCERDGSLNFGYEVISQPMTMNYLKANSDRIKEMLKTLARLGQRSDETNTCGLHIHTSRNAYVDEEAIARACYIVTYFEKQISSIARRRDNSYSSYREMRVDGVPTVKKINEKVKYGGRYCSVNVQNSNTIEYRMFKGTLNPNTFFASIELINNIVRMANSKKNVFRFEELISGDYLPAYVELRKQRSTIDLDKSIDMSGLNQDELLARLKEKWGPVKAIRDYNKKHPDHPITPEQIFGGAR